MSKLTEIRDGAVAKIPTEQGDRAYIPDNSVGTAKLEDLAVTEPKLSAAVAEKINTSSHKNYIINGDMNISQRGTSFPAIGVNAYSLDRWIHNSAGAVAFTISQDTDVPTTAQAGYLFTNSLRMNVTTADAAIASTDYASIRQYVEGYNFRNLAQKTFTLSFWVKSSVSGTYCVAFRNNGGDRSYVAEYSISSINTWEYKTITVSASPSAGSWSYTNAAGIRIEWFLSCGSSLQTTPNTWQTGLFFATSNQVNATGTIGNDFRLTGVMLNEGSQAMPFRPFADSFQGELDACMRYYYQVNSGTGSQVAEMVAISTTRAVGAYRLPVALRASPTLTTSTITGIDLATGSSFDITSLTQRTYSPPNVSELDAQGAVGLTNGGVYRLLLADAAAFIAWSAEL